jgi:hypothetical protein
MMKEFVFEPASQIIDILDGTIVNVFITGRRVAFSCFGAVISLNGEPESGIHIEALSYQPVGHCSQHQEETKTEHDGTFRLRGLQPRCEYYIQLKSGNANSHIERSIPKFIRIQIENKDYHNLNVLAFRRLNLMDISGIIFSSQEFLSSLKIQLYRDAHLDSPLHSISLSSTPFFYLPSILMDNQVYILRLITTLSKTNYDFTLNEINFVANTTYRHFTMYFEPQRKVMDQELSHSSVLVIPLAIIILCLAFNYNQVVSVLSSYFGILKVHLMAYSHSVIMHPSQSSSNEVLHDESHELLLESSTTKRKLKAKKIQ